MIAPWTTSLPKTLAPFSGKMSTHAKMSLASIAMALREEQLQAKVVHYKPSSRRRPSSTP